MEDKTAAPQQLVDHLFRHEAGRMIAVLTRIFGMHNLELAEDVMQAAFLKTRRSGLSNLKHLKVFLPALLAMRLIMEI